MKTYILITALFLSSIVKAEMIICSNESKTNDIVQLIANKNNEITKAMYIINYFNPDYAWTFFLNKDKSSPLKFFGELGDCNDQVHGGQAYAFEYQNGKGRLDVYWCDDDGGAGNYSHELNCTSVYK